MNEQIHILVVDDEEDMVELVTSYLRNAHYQVSRASDGFEMLEKMAKQTFDLILLDVMMPYMDGVTACKKVRETSDVPIIMLTAKGDEADRVNGLKIGADDYIVKPFSPNELLARIEALLRRSHQRLKPSLLRFGELVIDENARTVRVDNQVILLTRKEFDLLLLLAKNKEQVFPREQLYELVWGLEHSEATLRTVDTHIKTLRMKLGEASERIQTVWGVGYKFEE